MIRIVLRLNGVFESKNLYVGSVCITHYAGQYSAADAFQHRLEKTGREGLSPSTISQGIRTIFRSSSARMDMAIMNILRQPSPLVVVTAPGPGSGKMATCLVPALPRTQTRQSAPVMRNMRPSRSGTSASSPSGEPGLRGGNRRPERCEHDRPVSIWKLMERQPSTTTVTWRFSRY